MKQILLVFLGAGLGGVLRHAGGPWMQNTAQSLWPALAPPQGAEGQVAFPIGTLMVNMSGCLAAGILGTFLATASGMREELRALLMVGLLGGYTTFSAFGRETMLLVEQRRLWEAGVYVLASNAAGLCAVWIGMRLAGWKAG